MPTASTPWQSTSRNNMSIPTFRSNNVTTSPYVIMSGSDERIGVGKIIGVGRNYAAHVKEMGHSGVVRPVLFLKPASAIVHHGGKVLIPLNAGEVHHEVELVVAIGKPGRVIPEGSALEHVLGYAVGLDMTLRDIQTEAKSKGEPWALAKGFDTSAPVSTLAPAEDVGDGSGLAITLDVNGRRRQESNTDLMLNNVASLVSFISRLNTLERGDLIFTGTPSGVGPVREGDILHASIDRVGRLEVTIASDPN